MMKIFMFMFSMIFLLLFKFNKKLIMYMYMYMLILLNFIFLLIFNYNDYWMNIYLNFGMDNYSMILIYLSLWILMFMMKVSFNVKNKYYYLLVLMILLIFLVLSFSCMNYFLFYMLFEISMIPTFMLIMGWGYQSERLNAGMYMFMYTMFSSLPLMMIIYYLYNLFNSLNFLLILLFNLVFMNMNQFIIYFFMFFAFFVKLPVFMFHMWLPKAHVEAPVTGSMILAGIMLKLGGYGIIRMMMMVLNFCMKFNYLIIILSLLGMFLLSLICLRQFDMKMLVAYSSVVHMALMLMSLFTLKFYGLLGGLFLMIAHGICSSGLFLMVNYLYERTKSRNIMINKGMIYLLPIFSMFFFMFCIMNMAAPPSLNLLSELMVVLVMMDWSMNILLMLIISMYLSASYSLYLYSSCIHGKFNNNLIKIFYNNVNNYMLMLIHLIPLNFIILKVNMMF
uniref:NADH-ubiquinone oxidoreductase chain 4 n=1 Tax=Pseudoligosita yasumatsui TaxID=3067466 RepID=A0AA49KEE8_9HYME|nr:NADH dehydrogenase subunit 4 [Pseudoligosita yasumatsui]WLF85677.1 NADH dehydrogenase subunit 4 [Pseudoligosita yasumatsui]